MTVSKYPKINIQLFNNSFKYHKIYYILNLI